MDTFDTHPTDGYSHSSSYGFGYTIHHGDPAGISHHHSFDDSLYSESISISEDTTIGDPYRIVRGIFTAEVGDLIAVLRNCGALRTQTECFWCLKELWRLLTDRSPGDLT